MTKRTKLEVFGPYALALAAGLLIWWLLSRGSAAVKKAAQVADGAVRAVGGAILDLTPLPMIAEQVPTYDLAYRAKTAAERIGLGGVAIMQFSALGGYDGSGYREILRLAEAGLVYDANLDPRGALAKANPFGSPPPASAFRPTVSNLSEGYASMMEDTKGRAWGE